METNKFGEEDFTVISNFYNRKIIHKAKVYIKNPNQAPQGAKIGRGQRGGLFYESSEQQHFRQEVSDIETNIKNTMKISDEQINSAQEIINKYEPIAKNEFKRVLSSVNGHVSYRVKSKYSMIEKIKRKGYKSFDELRDVFGMRIEVNNVNEVYNTVNKLKEIYGNKIIKNEDAITNARGLYRSYHIDVQYEPGIYGEIQIRTPLMDKVANASHILLYKNTTSVDNIIKTNIAETLQTYSDISVNKAKMTDIKMLPKTKEILSRFGL